MSLAILGAVSAASTLISAVSQISAAQSAAAAETASAEQAAIEADLVTARATREAGIARRQGREEAAVRRKAGKRLVSTQQARFAKAGVTFAGSPMLVLSETVAEAETEALRSLRGGRERAVRTTEAGEDVARARRFEAGQRLFRAGQIRTAGFTGAGTSLLTGGLRTAGIFIP